MPDRDLLEIFDAVLPRLECYGPGSVPDGGADEAEKHERTRSDRRTELGIFAAATGVFGLMAWMLTGPWLPLWFIAAMYAPAVLSGAAAAKRFLTLAFDRRLEQSLPPGTDAVTARLEDGLWSGIRHWNADAFIWNQRVAALRLEISGWQLLKDVPEARDIEWTEEGSMIQADGLIAAMRGLTADRAALVARKDAIERELRRLDARLHRLKAAEEAPTLALAAPRSEDPPDDG